MSRTLHVGAETSSKGRVVDTALPPGQGVTLIDGLADAEAVGREAARLIAAQLERKPESRLAFATGKTPKPAYALLSQWTREGRLDWSQSHLFHLDEYVNPAPNQKPPYKTFAEEIDEGLWQALPETAHRHYMRDYPDPLAYERALLGEDGAGPDLIVLGIGGNGHIAFNEPGSPPDSPSRVITLAEQTILANFGALNQPGFPTQAMTLGLGVILKARTILLLATRGKENIVRRALIPDTPPSADIPASWLKRQGHVCAIADFSVFESAK